MPSYDESEYVWQVEWPVGKSIGLRLGIMKAEDEVRRGRWVVTFWSLSAMLGWIVVAAIGQVWHG